MLEKVERAQIVARLIKAATAERRDQFALRDDSVGRDLMFAPGEYPQSPNMRLVRELLDARPDALPPGFRMIYEMTPKPGDPPFARLFAIERPAASRAPQPPQS